MDQRVIIGGIYDDNCKWEELKSGDLGVRIDALGPSLGAGRDCYFRYGLVYWCDHTDVALLREVFR